jgi:hypothetical protein
MALQAFEMLWLRMKNAEKFPFGSSSALEHWPDASLHLGQRRKISAWICLPSRWSNRFSCSLNVCQKALPSRDQGADF